MKQSTQDKFAAILAAAQNKANNQATPKFTEPVKPEPTPEPIKPTPELSSFTIEDILTGCEPAENDTPATAEANNGLEIVDYSDKAFAIIGQTKPIKDELKALGGRFNMFLKCGAGWIFPKTRMDAVRTRLSL